MLPDALERPEIDHNIDERIVVGNRLPIAQSGTFNSQVHRLRVDPFCGRALLVDRFIRRALAIQLMPQPCSDAGWEGRRTATFTFGPVFVPNGTGRRRRVWSHKWTSVAALFMGTVEVVDQNVDRNGMDRPAWQRGNPSSLKAVGVFPPLAVNGTAAKPSWSSL